MAEFPTYAYDGETVIAFHGNQVIASGTDFGTVSKTAEKYFDTLKAEHQRTAQETRCRTATHITTPNGDQGVILGRTSSVFSDAITVRFENGQIRHYDTFVGDGLKYATQDPEMPKSPIEYFQRKLDEIPVPGRNGLTARINDLNEVRRDAAHLASQGVSYADGKALHQIVLTAEAERNEVLEALEYLAAADAEAMVPPTRAYTAVEQASVGHSSDWLEVVAQEMIAESEAEDFDKLLAEGPTQLTSNLEMGALANAGVVRDLAIEHVHTKTAGFQGEAVEDYRDQFVAATEIARRQELVYRQDVVKKATTKEAKTLQDVPDEALFL